MRDSLSHSEDIDRRLPTGPCPRCRRDNDGSRSIRDETAIAHGQRRRHHAGGKHIFNVKWTALHGLRVKCGPTARRDSHFGELLAGGAKFDHMALRDHCVGGHRTRKCVRRLIGTSLRVRGKLCGC
ncbi:hypothetical protein X962_5896 [Burkholderia pseudomallei MSHR7343]|nr:hypothetical protein X962_5896 [Burkholderia pseudomallei MSHR7343]